MFLVGIDHSSVNSRLRLVGLYPHFEPQELDLATTPQLTITTAASTTTNIRQVVPPN